MDYSELEKEIKRLNFEDLLWLIFALLSFLNIYGDYNDIEYLKSHDDQYE